MIYHYEIVQGVDTVTIQGDDDEAMREKAHRIARKSLVIDTKPVTIRRKGNNGEWRRVAILSSAAPTRKDINRPAYDVKGVKPQRWGDGGVEI